MPTGPTPNQRHCRFAKKNAVSALDKYVRQVCVKGRICVCGDVIQITRFCFYENYWENSPLTEQKEKEPGRLDLGDARFSALAFRHVFLVRLLIGSFSELLVVSHLNFFSVGYKKHK